MSSETLEAIFVQREKLAQDLIAGIKESATTQNKHYRLLVGMRGIGKTHTIALIYHRLRSEAELKNKLLIAWLKEEEWGVSSWLDLLMRIFQALEGLYPQEYQVKLAPEIENLYELSPEEATIKAEIILKEFTSDRTLLLLAENLDEIFAGLKDKGQKKFRAYLQNNNFITIVATSQSLFNGVTNNKSPFYGFFNPHNLDKLSITEATNLLNKIAELKQDSELTQFIASQTGKDRIQAIHHLAAGNHRVYIIFSQFLTRDSLDELVQPVMQTLDELTPYYQARMQWLSPQQRKIIELLCDRRDAVPVKEIARRCFITHQTTSSQLKDLLIKGYVSKESQGRESFYELQEPLMRICLEVKKQRGEPIKLFVDFLRIWYTQKELEERYTKLPKSSIEKVYIAKALELQQIIIEDDVISNPNSQFYKLMNKAYDSFAKKDFNMALEYSIQATDNEPKNYHGWNLAGFIFNVLNLYEEAIEYINTAIEINPDDDLCWRNIGLSFEKMEYYEEALESYEEAIKINSNHPLTWVSKGYILYLLSRYKEAIESYEKSIEIDPFIYQVWILYAQLFDEIENYVRAAECYKKAINLNDSDEIAWTGYALALNHIGEQEKAIYALNNAIKLNDQDYFIFCVLGEILLKTNRWNDGFSNLDKFLSLSEYSKEYCVWNTNEVVKTIFEARDKQNIWMLKVRNLIKLSDKYEATTDLTSGILENIPDLMSETVSDKTARTWLEVWQEVAGDKPELEIALRWLKVAVEYKEKKGDKLRSPSARKVLFQLPKEERDLFVTLLDETDKDSTE